MLRGGAGNDTLNGGIGDDTMYGGAGADTFVFSTGNNHDTVIDFVSGTDKIDLTAYGFADFAAVQAAMHDDGDGNAVIDFGGGNDVTLNGVHSNQVQSGDVILSAGPAQVEAKGEGALQQMLATDHMLSGVGVDHFGHIGVSVLPAYEYLL